MAPPRLVVLTGAGVSAESGLGTFRDKGGLWTQFDLADVATPDGFARNTDLVHQFYNARRANAAAAVPNAAHVALARLSMALGDDLLLVTQNVDDLHERAGSRDVVHMHGTLTGAVCGVCAHRWTAPAVMTPRAPCPACGRPTTRPDIVWFGEIPFFMDRIAEALQACDIFVAIGTSGTVYPAAGFVAEAAAAGAETLELNLEPSAVVSDFDASRFGPASVIVPAWVDEVLQGR
ncbi:MAG: Sir2 family NAD-dependent protein deacetylase [Gemmobacter sp.]|nr:Sir2 family NAD-dependent protein deacetylase [Gemmobacter sp.]